MSEEPEFAMILYTLCVDGAPIAVCALPSPELERNAQDTVRSALFETWEFGGGALMQLVGREIQARRPTRRERKEWQASNKAFGKPYLVLGNCDEARGTA
jgi:hypothetical protein